SAISIREIVGAFARVLDRDIHYEEISDDQWRSEVVARGWNAHAVEHLSSLWKSLRAASLSAEAARFAVTDTIEKIGGAKPKTFEQFVREQQSELATQPAAARAQAWVGGEIMNRRQLMAAALVPLELRVVPDALSSNAFAAPLERDG